MTQMKTMTAFDPSPAPTPAGRETALWDWWTCRRAGSISGSICASNISAPIALEFWQIPSQWREAGTGRAGRSSAGSFA